MKFFLNKGISAIEILIVVSIMVLLVIVVLPSFTQMRNAQILQNSTLDVFNALNKAKTNTFAAYDSKQYGVHFSSTQVIIFEGTTYNAGASTNEIITLDSRSSISTISLVGGGSIVYFNRIYGRPNTTGTITISTGSLTKTVSVGATGNISVN